MITSPSANVVQSWRKTAPEVNELYDWLHDHSITIKYLGGCRYYVYGEEAAVLFKLRWGA